MALRRELTPHPSQAFSRGSACVRIIVQVEPNPHPRHASILAKLEPQMQRIVLVMMMETVEGVCSIEKGEGVDMD